MTSTFPTRLLTALLGAAALAFAVGGCGTGDADAERGRALFIQNCGNCHTLAQAGTSATIGPDLDAAFHAARASGQNDAMIEGVTADQIANPRPGTDNPANSMPADIVTGKDLDDVAAYVGRWAGVPGAKPPTVAGGPGAQVFANQGCGGCHTLAAANAGGTTGPNLDEVLPGQSQQQIHKSIVEPDAHITPGYAAGIMPSNYETLIDAEELQELVKFLATKSGGGGSK